MQLFELGRVSSTYFISMEYIRGQDLRQVLRQARRTSGLLPCTSSLHCCESWLMRWTTLTVAPTRKATRSAWFIATSRRPTCWLRARATSRFIDFGIAKATSGRMQTHTGRIKGKLSYMAPEALNGKSLDGRSDLFSTAVIAYELLTARPLFAARNDFQTIERVQGYQPPPPSMLNPSCPGQLDDIVLKGLAKDSRPALEHGW